MPSRAPSWRRARTRRSWWASGDGALRGLRHHRPDRRHARRGRARRRRLRRSSRPRAATFFNVRDEAYEPEVTHVDWDLDVAEKGGYPDFMMKEIHEQPRVIRDTLAGRLVNGALSIDELDLSPEELNLIDRVCVIACGTSYHAGLIAKNLIEGWARIPCEVEVASEFRYRNPIITPSTLVVAVSQSGETADTLAAIRDARVKGAKVFGITNVVGSPVARESDGVIYTKANKEIAVASTKSFLGQVVSLTLLAMLLGQRRASSRRTRCACCSASWPTRPSRWSTSWPTPPPSTKRRSRARTRRARCSSAAAWAPPSLRGRAQAQGDQLPARRGLPGRRDEARPHRASRRGLPRHRGGHEEPRVRQAGVEPSGGKARGADDRGVATEGDEDIRAHADHVDLHPEGARRVLGHHGQRAAAAVRARHRRRARLRRGPAPQPGEIGYGRVAFDLRVRGRGRRRPVARTVLASLRNSLGGRRRPLPLQAGRGFD
ncbi:MAG: SIS domain-containing protein [Gordonibacter pamelaeae]